jgi:broad specificity phosphatase PhoE
VGTRWDKGVIVYLVRHGQVDRRTDLADPPLSDQGQREAEQVAAYLRARPIRRVYSSPLRRTQETAALIAAELGLPLIVEPRLRERANFGDLPGQTFEEFVTLWERCSQERDYLPPVGDSSLRAGQRMEEFIADTYAALPDGEVVAVGHGGLIADFLLNICTLDTLAQTYPGFAAQPYSAEVMRNGAITVVEYTGVEYTGNCSVGCCYSIRTIAFTYHLSH